MLARSALALVAVVALAWLGAMERNQRLIARATGGFDGGVSAREAGWMEPDLRDARLLNPSTTPDLLLAGLYAARGQRARAAALTVDVVRREPDNIQAWMTRYRVVRNEDAGAEFQAEIEIQQLDPVSARPR